MTTVTNTDVIIVGAGPTGLSLAVQLMRYGIDFKIFDVKAGVTDLSKALVVHARTLEIAVVKTASGETQTLAASYLVGCDGASSPTRHLLKLGFEGSTYPRLFYVADVEMEFPADRSTLYPVLGQDAFVLMVPMQGEQHWRLIGNLPEYDRFAERDVTFDEVEKKVKQLVQQPLTITTVRWFSTYKVHTRHAAKFSVDRCFLAGDAAHVHTPAGGQGMNTGIQDAYNLAWKIALVLKGAAGDALLETYNEERLANAKRLLQTTDRMFEIMAGDRWYLRFFRTKILPSLAGVVMQSSLAKEFLFPTVSQIGLNYRDSLLSKHLGDKDFKVKAGDRMPYFLVDGANVYDKLRAPKFHLIVFADDKHGGRDLQLEIEHEYGDLIDFNVMQLDPRVVEIFGTNRPFQVLLRPDNYIGSISTEVSLADIKAYLRH